MIPQSFKPVSRGGKLLFLVVAVAFSLLSPPVASGNGMARSSGLFKNIYNEDSVEVHNTARINAEFENRGDAATTALFVGEIYLEGKLVESIRSGELYVYPREKVNLTCYFTPHETGNYEIRGFVLHSKTSTNAKKSLLQVLPRKDEEPDRMVVQLNASVLAIAIVSICILVIYLAGRKEKFGRKQMVK